jgi:hypothetical protein
MLPRRASPPETIVCQLACKPGSVWRVAPPRRPFLCDAACAGRRATNPGGGSRSHLDAELPRQPCRPYSVLLPVGFAVPLTLPQARCALTAPFHPYRREASLEPAVCSLWHFPWGRPRRPLAATVDPWSPDFPPPGLRPQSPFARQRPSGQLAGGIRGVRAGRSRGLPAPTHSGRTPIRCDRRWMSRSARPTEPGPWQPRFPGRGAEHW